VLWEYSIKTPRPHVHGGFGFNETTHLKRRTFNQKLPGGFVKAYF
jgi:hypothetical protein